jgi:hypothetical protein
VSADAQRTRARVKARTTAAAARTALARRDAAVVAAVRAGVPYRELAEATGLPLATLSRIAHRP